MDTSLSKSRFTELCKLRKNHKSSEQVIVEGRNCLKQLVENGFSPREIYLEKGQVLDLDGSQSKVFELKSTDFLRLCDTKTPSGIAALFDRPKFTISSYTRALYLDGISDPGNMGTIFRCASSFGIDMILLSPACCDSFSPKVIRSSLGAVFWVQHQVVMDEWLFAQNAELIALVQNGDIPLEAYEPLKNQMQVFVIGSEAAGVRSSLISRCSTKLKLKMSTNMESLNASVSAAILCWWLFIKNE